MARITKGKQFEKPDWFNLQNYEEASLVTPKEISICLSQHNEAVGYFSAYQKKHTIQSKSELDECLEDGNEDSRIVGLHFKLLKNKYLPQDERKTIQRILNIDSNNPLSSVPIGKLLEDLKLPIDQRKYFSDDIVELLSDRSPLTTSPRPSNFDVYQADAPITKNIDDMTQDSPTKCALSVVTSISFQDERYISECVKNGVQDVNSTEPMKKLDKVYLSVNLSATKEQLLESFESLLSGYKQLDSLRNKDLNSELLKVAEYKSIPYLDLELYAILIGKTTTNTIMEELLFPEGYGEKFCKDSFRDANKTAGVMKRNRLAITNVDFIRNIELLKLGG